MFYKPIKIGIGILVLVTSFILYIFQLEQSYILMLFWGELSCLLLVGFIYPYFYILSNQKFFKTDTTILDVYQETDNDNHKTHFYLANFHFEGKEYQHRFKLKYDPKKVGEKFKIYVRKNRLKEIYVLEELHEYFIQCLVLGAFLTIVILNKLNVF